MVLFLPASISDARCSCSFLAGVSADTAFTKSWRCFQVGQDATGRRFRAFAWHGALGMLRARISQGWSRYVSLRVLSSFREKGSHCEESVLAYFGCDCEKPSLAGHVLVLAGGLLSPNEQ